MLEVRRVVLPLWCVHGLYCALHEANAAAAAATEPPTLKKPLPIANENRTDDAAAPAPAKDEPPVDIESEALPEPRLPQGKTPSPSRPPASTLFLRP